MTTKRKILIAAFAVFAVLCGVLVAVFVALHTEPTFLTACETGELRLDTEGDCFEVRPRLPLRVTATSSNPHPVNDPADATRAAIGIFNARARLRGHCDPFVYVDAVSILSGMPVDYDVLVRIGEPIEVGSDFALDGGRGITILSKLRDGRITSEISTFNTGTVETLHEVLAHELAHAAGLAHDPFADSVVSETFLEADPSRLEDPGLRRLWVTDDDVDALGELCP